jgi:NAD(P)-dependent dehydrogenase (short-subunit alcohol dehydrogenase family)
MTVPMATHAEFDAKTDASTVVKAFPESVRGKIILITGANSLGIGGTTAVALASQNPKLLILTGRSEAKVQEVIESVKAVNPHVEARFLQLDLSSQISVRKAAAEVMSYEEPIDIVINNAGVMALPERQISPDGLEIQFATNHIGHFLFVNLISAKLIEAAKRNPTGATRVVNVSSFGHMFGPIRFSDYNFNIPSSQLPESEKPDIALMTRIGLASNEGSDPKAPGYNPFAAYAQSKTANILLSLSLTQKLASHGIQSFGLHPGSIETELTRHMEGAELTEARRRAVITRKTLEQGSSTSLVAALDPVIKAEGKNYYLSDCQLQEAASWAVDSESAEKLWKLSESLVGEKFTYA